MQKVLIRKNIKHKGALYRRVSFVLAISLIILLFTPVCAKAISPVPTDVNGLTAEHYASGNFESHMPILVLDVPEDTEPEDSGGYFLPADISVFEGMEKNTIQNEATASVSATLRNMTDKEDGVDIDNKSDYYLRLSEAQSWMGLGTTSEYLLLGGSKDKSLLRNYLGYTLSDKINQQNQTNQLCEVLFRMEDGDLYQGVYLLVALSLPENSTLFHRSPEEDGIVIDTYATQNGLTDEFLTIPFMESTEWNEKYSEIIGEFSIAESVLYATDSSGFYKHAQRYDVQSFMKTFLLGEITQNYSEMNNTYYYYDKTTGQVAVAPIYNFETAFDNERTTSTEVGQMEYQEAPYYAEFFKSPQFTRQVQALNLSVRKSGFNESDITELLDAAAAYVAPVIERDWARWDSYSGYVLQAVTKLITEEDEVIELATPFRRQSATYEQEILRIRYRVRAHSLSTGLALTRFDFNEKEINREIVLNTNPIWIVVFVVVLFAAINFARRYGQ